MPKGIFPIAKDNKYRFNSSSVGHKSIFVIPNFMQFSQIFKSYP